MITRRHLLASSAATLALPGLLRAQGESYSLGALYSMSGATAEYGRIYMEGTQLAIDHIAEDKMLSRPIDMHVEDSRGTPQGGAVGISKLINVDKAIYVLIGFTGVSKAAAPIAERTKTVLVNGGAVGPDLATLMPYFWNVIPLANLEVRGLVPYLMDNSLKRLAIVYVDDPAGAAIRDELEKSVPEAGGEIAGTYSIPLQSQQFSALATNVREAQPDAIFMASYGGQQLQIIKQFRDAGIETPFVSYSALNIEPIKSLPEADGSVFTTQATNFESDDPVTARFVKDFRARYGAEPVTYHQNYYNATRLFGLLTAELEKQGKEVNGDNLREVLLAQRSFDLVGGRGEFNEHGTLSMPIQLNRIENGKTVVIG